MEHTSASGAFNLGRSKWQASAKAQVLRSTSALALGRVIPNAVLPGLVLAGSMLIPSNHLEALDIPAGLKVPIHSLTTIIAPPVGAPVVVVPLDPSPEYASSTGVRAERTVAEADTVRQESASLAPGVMSDSLGDWLHQRSPVHGNLWRPELLSEWLDLGKNRFSFRQDFIASLSQSIERLTAESLLESTHFAASLVHALESWDLRTASLAGGGSAPPLPAPLPAANEYAYGDRRLWEFLTLGQAAYVAEVGIDDQPMAGSGPLGGGNEAAIASATTISKHHAPLPDPALRTSGFGLFTGLAVKDVPSHSGTERITSRLGGHLVHPTSFEGPSDLRIRPAPFDAQEWQTTLAPLIEIAAPTASQSVDLWAEMAPPAPVANTAPLIVPADSLVNDKGDAFVRLGTLIDLLSDRFDAGELSRLQKSSANASYVPLRVLHENGIAVQIAGIEERLTGESGLAQSNGAAPDLSPGASGEQSGATSSLTKMIDMSASLGFDSNPFLAAGTNAEAASARLQITPTVERSGSRGSFRASGRAEHIEYLSRYGSLQNFGADLAAAHRLTERLRFNASALFRSDVLGTNLTNPFVGQDNINPVDPGRPGGGDVTLLGQRQRREQFGADAGLTLTPSARDELRWSASFRADRFATGALIDSDFYSQQLRYSRQVNSAISVGAVVDASIINFTDAALGDTRTVSPQALVVARLGERFEASASLGVAFSKVDLASVDQTDAAVAGSLSLCYRSEVSRLCANGNRQVLPSAIGGARVQTTGGLSYSLRVSERDSLQFGGSYSTASEPLTALGGDFQSINAFARYERTLNERTRLQASVGYIDTSGGAAVNASSFQALVGISVRFGRDR